MPETAGVVTPKRNDRFVTPSTKVSPASDIIYEDQPDPPKLNFLPFHTSLEDPPTGSNEEDQDNSGSFTSAHMRFPVIASTIIAASPVTVSFTPPEDVQQKILTNLLALLSRVTATAEPLGSGTWINNVTAKMPIPVRSVEDVRTTWNAKVSQPPALERRKDLLYRRFTVADLGSQEGSPRRSLLAGLYRRDSLLDLRYASSAKLSQQITRSPLGTPVKSLMRVCVCLHARRALRKVLRDGFEATRAYLRELGCEECVWQAYFPSKCAAMQDWQTYLRAFTSRFESCVHAFNADCWGRGLDELLRLRAIVLVDDSDNFMDAPEGDEMFPSVAFQLAYFLLATPSVKRSSIGRFLNGNGHKVNTLLEAVTMYLAELMDFATLDVGSGLRFFTSHFPIGGESQVIYRSMDAFAKAYCNCRLREVVKDLLEASSESEGRSELRVPLATLLSPRNDHKIERVTPHDFVLRTRGSSPVTSETMTAHGRLESEPQTASRPSRMSLRRLLPGLGGSSCGENSPSGATSTSSRRTDAPQYSGYLGRRELAPSTKKRARLWFKRRRVRARTPTASSPCGSHQDELSTPSKDEDDTFSVHRSELYSALSNTRSSRHLAFQALRCDDEDPMDRLPGSLISDLASTHRGTIGAAPASTAEPTHGCLKCHQGSLHLYEADLHRLQDATLAIGYAMVMLNTSQHHAALTRKAKLSKGTFRQMIGSVDIKVPPELIDQWFGSFSAYPLRERDSSLVEFYNHYLQQASWLWQFDVSPPPSRNSSPSTQASATFFSRSLRPDNDTDCETRTDPLAPPFIPMTTMVRMSGPKRQHVRYMWVDARSHALNWCGVFSTICPEAPCGPSPAATVTTSPETTGPAPEGNDMRRSTSRLKHKVTTRFRHNASKDHSPALDRIAPRRLLSQASRASEEVATSSGATPRLQHTRVQTCIDNPEFEGKRVDHQRFSTAPPTATLQKNGALVNRSCQVQSALNQQNSRSVGTSGDLRSVGLQDVRGFAIVPMSRIRMLMYDATEQEQLRMLECSKVFSTVQKDGNSRGSLLQVVIGAEAQSTLEFILPDTLTPAELQKWNDFLIRVVRANVKAYESSRFTPTIQRPYRMVAQLPSSDAWDWSARLLFSREAKARTRAWALIHKHQSESAESSEGPDSWRVLDWLATMMSTIPEVVMPDGLHEKHLESNLMRDVYASRMRTKEPAPVITLLEQMAIDAAARFPLLFFPAQALNDASVRSQHWIVHHLTFGQTDLMLCAADVRDVVHGHLPVSCRLIDLGLEISAIPNNMRRRSTVVRCSNAQQPVELTYSPGVRWAVQGFSSVHICTRLVAALIKRSLIRVPRLAHFYLLGWLSQLLPLHRSSGLIVAAGFLTLLELRTDLMDFAADEGFGAVISNIEAQVPLHVRHWREIGFDLEGSVRDWFVSAFIGIIPLQGLARCWSDLFEPSPLGGVSKSPAVGGDNGAFASLACRLVQLLTLRDSALMLGHAQTAHLFSTHLKRALWDIYVAS